MKEQYYALAVLMVFRAMLWAEPPCVITDQAAPFVIHTSTRDAVGGITLAWESCPDHLYEVQVSPELSHWSARAVLPGGDGVTIWTDRNLSTSGQRFYRVQRLAFDGDEDADGVSNLEEFNRGTDLRHPDIDVLPSDWQPQFNLPVSMIVGETATLSVVGTPATCACQWSIVSGKAFFTNTVNCTTDLRPQWSGAVTVQVVCATAQGAYTNRARTVVAFPKRSPVYDWNASFEVQNYNNCYNFSTDIRTDTFAQPGVAGGVPAVWPPPDCQPDTAGAVADGLRANVNIDDLCHTSGLPQGHIIALLVAPYSDYHFIRLEADGTWASKAGNTAATTLDNAGRPITDPRTANFLPYHFCGFL
ncbi:MAG TPA: hypothetical protein VJ063_04295, partial [Verrucomicrobiae bacterium]|nr:hypothetical protein [Verrucomicrobiae bacterium]